MPDPDDRPRLAAEPAGSLTKVTGLGEARLARLPDDQPLTATIRVASPRYLPAGLHLRARISDTLFTADLIKEQLADLERDPHVLAVELAEPLG